MFKYFYKILSQFSVKQKINALIILCATVLIATIVPILIKSFILDEQELKNKIENQRKQISYLEIQVDSINIELRNSKKECTNLIIERENEFLELLEKLQKEILKTMTEKRSINLDTINNLEINYRKNDDLLNIYIEIDKMKKKI
jgi:hypothetical protein